MRSSDQLSYSWDEYYQLIETLADRVRFGDISFDRVICLARGGSIVGDALSRILDLPLGILMVSSYDRNRKQTPELQIGTEVTRIGSVSGNILLVDDLVDTGATFMKVIPWLVGKYPDIDRIETAVLWHKPQSICQPTYSAVDMVEDLWINQPFETVI
jgi:uncharacterized protein